MSLGMQAEKKEKQPGNAKHYAEGANRLSPHPPFPLRERV